MTQNLEDPSQLGATCFVSDHIQRSVPSRLVHYASGCGPFPVPLIGTHHAALPAAAPADSRCSLPEAFSFVPAWREVKSLWAEASTECPLYMHAYQSSNSLECCTSELLPPCVCVAAQECVYILSLSKEINNAKWQINRTAFFFSFYDWTGWKRKVTLAPITTISTKERRGARLLFRWSSSLRLGTNVLIMLVISDYHMVNTCIQNYLRALPNPPYNEFE